MNENEIMVIATVGDTTKYYLIILLDKILFNNSARQNII